MPVFFARLCCCFVSVQKKTVVVPGAKREVYAPDVAERVHSTHLNGREGRPEH